MKFDWERAYERLERARVALDAPEDERAVLERRARALAAPLVVPDVGVSPELVVFRLGGERFALPAERVREALPLHAPTPLPGTPAHVRGVVNHRGRVVAVLDVRTWLGGSTAAALTHAVVVSVAGLTFALAAEAVEEIGDEREPTLLDLDALAAEPWLRIDDKEGR